MKKNSGLRTTSRTATPWDDLKYEKLDPLQRLLQQKYREHFFDRHIKLSETDEAKFLNQFELTTCRRCGSDNIIHFGTKNKLNRYYCKDCRHTFVITTNTIFDCHKLSVEQWIEYCLDLFGFASTNLASKTNKNSESTANYWLNKVFLLLKDYGDDIKVSGQVQIDEKYYKERANKIQRKPDGKEFSGLSRNQYCIFMACDDHMHVYAHVNGSGKPSQKRCWESLGSHIEPGSHLIHDKERSHSILIRKLNLTSDAYDSKVIDRLPDKDNPLHLINSYHSLLEKFLNAHSGFDREHLQDYINLFMYLYNGSEVPLERVYQLIKMGLTKPITLRYRELYHADDTKKCQ